jgi:hypothetical protein
MITILDLAKHRGLKADEDGALSMGAFADVGLAMLGGCAICGASIAAYNAYPTKHGFWMCKDCVCDGDGWDDVEEANRDIFKEVEV